MFIKQIAVEQLGAVIAGLVREGLTFEAHYDCHMGTYTIELTGGY